MTATSPPTGSTGSMCRSPICSSRCSFRSTRRSTQKVERVVQTSPFRFRRDDIARRLDAATADREGFHGPRITLEAPTMPPMGLDDGTTAVGHEKTRAIARPPTPSSMLPKARAKARSATSASSWQRGDTFVAPGWNAISPPRHIGRTDFRAVAMSHCCGSRTTIGSRRWSSAALLEARRHVEIIRPHLVAVSIHLRLVHFDQMAAPPPAAAKNTASP